MSSRLLVAPLASALLVALPTYASNHSHSDHDHDHAAHGHDSADHDHDHGTEAHATAESGLAIATSLTLEGLYYNRFSGDESSPAGFGVGGHEHGHGEAHGGHDHGFDDGFSLGHSEVALHGETALFEGQATISLSEEDISLEEAFLATRALPGGLRLKAGKFLSDIGYINSRHPHAWDFVERPLVNEYLFGDHGLLESGVQLTYSPNVRTVFGTELFQGGDEGLSRYDEGGFEERDSGPRVATLFAKHRPIMTDEHALELGLSTGWNRQYASVDDHGDHAHSLEGDNWFAGVDGRYHYHAGRPGGQGDWQVGSEYFYTARDVTEYVEHHHGWEARDDYNERQDGAYLEVIYGVAPRWEAGIRAEALGLTNKVVGSHPTSQVSEDTSYRYSGQATWHVHEDVFIRAQLSREEFAGQENSWVGMVQVNATFGHHAH